MNLPPIEPTPVSKVDAVHRLKSNTQGSVSSHSEAQITGTHTQELSRIKQLIANGKYPLNLELLAKKIAESGLLD